MPLARLFLHRLWWKPFPARGWCPPCCWELWRWRALALLCWTVASVLTSTWAAAGRDVTGSSHWSQIMLHTVILCDCVCADRRLAGCADRGSDGGGRGVEGGQTLFTVLTLTSSTLFTALQMEPEFSDLLNPKWLILETKCSHKSWNNIILPRWDITKPITFPLWVANTDHCHLLVWKVFPLMQGTR